MKLSIITINYNNALGLERTIKSIISHKTDKWEYIVIDGNSSDESINIIKNHDQKIDYWVSEPDSGIYNGMNKGIRKATGEYLLFINSGDTIHSKANLNDIIAGLIEEDIVYYDLEILDDVTNESYIKIYPNKPDFKYFLEDTLPHTASFIKRQLLVDYGYYSEKKRITSDWAFFMDAVCQRKCTIKHINDYFSTFYLDGISSDDKNKQLLLDERDTHISNAYSMYYSLYRDWMDKRMELYKLKSSFSVKTLKKIGFLQWLKL